MKLLVFFSFIIFNYSYAQDGSITFLKGKIQINGTKADKTSSFNYGDTLKVGKSSLAVIKVLPNTIIKLKANTELTIKKPRKAQGKTHYSYLLKYGDIFIKAQKKKKNNYSVQAKDAVMGVRGTQFFVSSSEAKKNIWMCVNEGEVAVSFLKSPNKEVFVKEGEGVVINSDKLPEVRQYSWTKELNWKTEGEFQQINDSTDIQNINYDLKNFDYE